METDIKILIKKVKECNLSQEEKILLLKNLEKKEPNIDAFLKMFMTLCRLSDTVLKLLNIDVFN